jgi:hypothetical protein
MRWSGNVGHVEEGRDVYRVFMGKPEGKKPPGRPRRRREMILELFFSKQNGGVD